MSNLFTKAERERLAPQYQRVWALMKDGAWVTLSGIQATTKAEDERNGVENPRGVPESSASARIREIRKVGLSEGWTVNSEHLGGGLHRYQVIFEGRAES